MQEKIAHLQSKILKKDEEGLRIEYFVDKGRGIIATREFSRNEFVIEYAGHLVDHKTAMTLEDVYSQDAQNGCYMFYFEFGGKRYCIDATAESPRMGRLINHSLQGNLKPIVVDLNLTPHIVFIAASHIFIGDEVTYDYGDRRRSSISHFPWLGGCSNKRRNYLQQCLSPMVPRWAGLGIVVQTEITSL